MSYDVALVRGEIPVDDDAAIGWIGDLLEEAESSGITSEWRGIYDRLAERFPSNFDDEEDIGVWNSPLQDSFFGRFAYLNIGYPSAKKVLPHLRELADEFSVHLFDLSASQILRTDGIPGLSLTVEGKAPHRKPTFRQLEAATGSLNPKAGCGFLILEGPGDDYVQAAGGGSSCSVEWREYSGAAFRHFVAGNLGPTSTEWIDIETNDAHVTVLRHERLHSGDIATILKAFAAKSERPAQYVWRDVSDQFKTA